MNKVWKSKVCLTLYPNQNFECSSSIKKVKKAWIQTLIKDDINILVVSAIMGILIAALGMTMAIFSQRLIDDILPNKDYIRLWSGIGLLTFLLSTRIGVLALRKYFLLRQEKLFNNRIISLFYDNLLFLPKMFFDNRKIGDLVARLNDTRRIQSVINLLLSSTIIDVFVIFVSLLFLFVYSWKIALIAIASVPPLFFIIYMNNSQIIKHQYEVMGGYALSESNFISTMQGITTIKNFNKQKTFSELNKNIYGFYLDKILNLGLINTKLGWMSGLCSIIIIVVILAYGAILVLKKELKMGELMAILTICNSILPSIASLALVIIPVNEAKVAFNRMFEFANIKPENKEINEDQTDIDIKLLEIKNLSFRFPGRSLLLKDISLNIKKGEITSLIGESGCGKSTLSSLLSKFYGFESGDIILNGVLSINDINVNNWRRMLGVAPQDIFIFNGTVLENICFEENNDSESIIHFLNEYGFSKYFECLPQGFHTLVGEEGINLSGGQKQLIALARALYKKPQFLILDEITSAMDQNTERFVLNLLLKLKKNIAILFISHRLHILRSISDKICVMDSGKIMVMGTHYELIRANDNLYKKYWESLSVFNS